MKMIRSNYTIGSSACMNDGSIWIASNISSAVMEFSSVTFECLNTYLIGEKTNTGLFSKILMHDGKLYLIPNNATTVWVIDCKEKHAIKIDIGLSEKEEETEGKIKSAYIWNNKLYLFGCNINGVIVYDLLDCTYRRIGQDILLNGKRYELRFYQVMACEGRYCYLPVETDEVIVRFDCEKQEFLIISEQDASMGRFNSACISSGKLYLSRLHERIEIVDLNDYGIDIFNPGLLADNQDGFYRRIVKKEDRLILIPASTGCIYYKCNEDVFQCIELDKKEYCGMTEYARYEFDFVYNGKIYIQCRTDGEIYIVNIDNMTVEKNYLYIDEESVNAISESVMRNTDGIIMESDTLSLKQYISFA